MADNRIIKGVPRLRGILPDNRIHLWDHFFFTKVERKEYDRALELAEQISSISRGKRTLLLSENSEVIGKLGEFVVRDFFIQNFNDVKWKSMVETVNEHGGDVFDLLVGDLAVDVKTRQLHSDVTVAPTIELRVPQTEFDRYQDVFILAGFCPETYYGYVFGWCTWDELVSSPIRTDIRFPARCVSLLDLHPMEELERYVSMVLMESDNV